MRWVKAAKAFSVVRDGLLVLVGLIYACGYVVWGVFSWREQLGSQSALDAQYFVAGIIPVFATFVVIGLYKFAVSRPKVRRHAEILRWVLVVVVCVAAYFFRSKYLSTMTMVLLVPVFIGLVLLAVSASTRLDLLDNRHNVEARRDVRMVLAGGIAIVGLTLFLYTDAIYPQLPIELGGGKPRCVNLELDQTKIGPALANQLMQIVAISTADGAPRTDEKAANKRTRHWLEQLGTAAAASPHMVETGPIFLWSSTDRWVLVGDDVLVSRRAEIPTQAITAMMGCEVE